MSKRQRDSHLLLRRIRSSRQKYISLDDLKKKYGITDNEEKKALNKIEFGITFDEVDQGLVQQKSLSWISSPLIDI